VLDDVDPDRAVAALVPETNAPFVAEVRAAAAAEGVRAVTISDLPTSLQPSVLAMSRGRGDFAPFEQKGVPYVFFSSGESGDYHEPSDTSDKLDPAILEARARVIVRFVVERSARER
jgi:Zn-dependent M28 family amino/carboxypeptidase